jgi:predicted transcriptional regulator
MDKQTITFRSDRKKIKALDRLARSLDRDRSYLLNEAVDHYLSVHEYHLEQIGKGLQEAREGKLVDYDKVKAEWMKRLGR